MVADDVSTDERAIFNNFKPIMPVNMLSQKIVGCFVSSQAVKMVAFGQVMLVQKGHAIRGNQAVPQNQKRRTQTFVISRVLGDVVPPVLDVVVVVNDFAVLIFKMVCYPFIGDALVVGQLPLAPVPLQGDGVGPLRFGVDVLQVNLLVGPFLSSGQEKPDTITLDLGCRKPRLCPGRLMNRSDACQTCNPLIRRQMWQLYVLQ